MIVPFSSWHILILLLSLSGGVGLPLGLPPGPEDATVANAAPEECLFYLSWAGAAKPDPQSENQLEQLIAEPEIQQFCAEVERRIHEGLRAAVTRENPEAAAEDPEGVAMVDDLVGLAKTALTSPGAIYLGKLDFAREAPPRIQAGAVFALGDDAAKARAVLEYHRKLLGTEEVQAVKIGEATFYRIKPPPDAPVFTWGFHGKHFVLGIGDGEGEAIVKRMSGSPPAWLAQVRKQLTVERPATVMYVNVKAIVRMIQAAAGEEAEPVIRGLGLGNFTSLASVAGLEKSAYVSRTLLATEKEAGDLLDFLGGKPLETKDLAPIPRDASLAAALRLDAYQLWQRVQSIVGEIDPWAGRAMADGLRETEKRLGFKIGEDLLQSLGDVWCIYNSPGEGGLVLTGLTAAVPLKDPDRARAAHAKLMALWNISAAVKATREDAPRRPREQATPIQHVRFAGQTIFTANPPKMGFPFAPSWCLTEKELIVALFPQNVKAYLSRGAEFQSLSAVPAVAGLFGPEGGPVALGYQDTPELFRLVYPILQLAANPILHELRREGIDVDASILPSAASIGKHLRPGVKAVRRTKAGIEVTVQQSLPGSGAGALLPLAASWGFFRVGSPVPIAPPPTARARSMNNLKQIALAMHTHHDALKSLPPAYSVDKNGKLLLNWRVAILPFVEQEGLWRQFRMDEPWDSEHNKKLIPLMPEVYRAPGSRAGPGKTNYLTVRGKDSMFPGAEKISFAQVKDGTSNTIMVVEAADSSAVQWTKPDDFVPDPKEPAKGLVGLRPGGFLAALGDGSVQFLPASADPDKLKALFTRAGQESVGPEDLFGPPRGAKVRVKPAIEKIKAAPVFK